MWGFASNTLAGTSGPKNRPEFSDDEISITNSRSSSDSGFECPICWESFNIVENIPYVLWCGHTLCKNCVLGLQWAVVKLPTLPIQLPFFISCPWCNLLSFRLIYKNSLKFPKKNYFLLWMVESMNTNQIRTNMDHHVPPVTTPWWARGRNIAELARGDSNGERVRMSLIFFVHLTAKFPLVVVFLVIVVYAIPASAVILAVYVLITILFAVPSFLVLYFAYPSLDWLVREIIN